MRIRALVVAAAASLALASPALGAKWERVTAPDGDSIDQVGLARTGDGTLHLAWLDHTEPGLADLQHTAISPAGDVAPLTPITTSWRSLLDPGLVATPSGLQVFFGGIRTTDAGEPNQDLNAATSADGGATWLLQIGSIIPLGAQAYGSDVSATALPDGTPLQAWAGTLGTWVHAGVNPSSPNHDYQAPLGAYGYNPGLATDATGQTVMAWYSNATGHLGVQAQSVAPDGSPVGAAATLPGTETMGSGVLARTPIAARVGGGFFVAYVTGHPAATRVRVWRVGDGAATVLARTSGLGNQPAAVAADPDGRIWVAWVQNNGGSPRVFARRSNEAVTRFGEAVDAGRAAGAPGAYSLDASVAPDGGLDLLAVFGIGTSPNAATYHARILPVLTIVATPGRLRNGSAQTRFRITDAGEPVAGARVKVGNLIGRTNTAGIVTLKLRSGKKRATVVATHEDYLRSSEQLRVRR